MLRRNLKAGWGAGKAGEGACRPLLTRLQPAPAIALAPLRAKAGTPFRGASAGAALRGT